MTLRRLRRAPSAATLHALGRAAGAAVKVVETGPAVGHLRPGRPWSRARSSRAGSAGTARGASSRCATTRTPTRGSPRSAGAACAGIFGYSHLTGGFAGSHARYVRVPFGNVGLFRVPDGVSDGAAVFASDAVPTGWMGAELADIEPGDVVAVWGGGGVGQIVARVASLLAAERVVVIDRFTERLEQAARFCGADTVDYSESNVEEVLLDITGGRGPDRCIEAIGMEAHGHVAVSRFSISSTKLRSSLTCRRRKR